MSLAPGAGRRGTLPTHRNVAPGLGAVGWVQGWIPQVDSLGCTMQGQGGNGSPSGLGVPLRMGAALLTPPSVVLQRPEVPDSSGEGVWAPHEELLHPSCPACCVSGAGVGIGVQSPPYSPRLTPKFLTQPGCPCWFPPLHHPGHRLPGHRKWHLPAGECRVALAGVDGGFWGAPPPPP